MTQKKSLFGRLGRTTKDRKPLLKKWISIFFLCNELVFFRTNYRKKTVHKGPFFSTQTTKKNGLILQKKETEMDTFPVSFLAQNGHVLTGFFRGIGGAARPPNKVVCATKWLANIELAKPLKKETDNNRSVLASSFFLNKSEEKQGVGRWANERFLRPL